jgi:hypothetical protein
LNELDIDKLEKYIKNPDTVPHGKVVGLNVKNKKNGDDEGEESDEDEKSEKGNVKTEEQKK